jgi:hypothetical protein
MLGDLNEQVVDAQTALANAEFEAFVIRDQFDMED